LLFAGTTSLISFKYSLFNEIVKKLKQRSISAGNIFSFLLCNFYLIINKKREAQHLPVAKQKSPGKCKATVPSEAKQEIDKNRTSETIRNETVFLTENVKPISVHVPKHLKPVSFDQFGHYLAGLIDGDGHFSSKQQLVIVFHSLDVSLAYYIKERIGFGKIKKVKNKNAYILVIASREGIEKVINLINGKIRTENKLNQIKKNILSHEKFAELKKTITLSKNNNNNLINH
jgi:hypothetical protein